MENINEFRLIKGDFNAQDSTSLVLSFFNTKIIFHNQQLLKLTKKAIIDFISMPIQSNPIFEIEGSITIKRKL